MKKNRIKNLLVFFVFVSFAFSCGEKNVQKDKFTASRLLPAQIIIDFIIGEKSKSLINNERYKELTAKTNLTGEEKSEFQEMNKILVQKLGPEIFINAIKEVTKGLPRLETIALESVIVQDYFDDATGSKIKSSLNIGRLKPAVDDMDTTLKDHQRKK
jgi:hypothetical protein